MKPKTGSHHFTNEFDYDVIGLTAILQSKVKTNLRKMDPWALCYKEWLDSAYAIKVNTIQLVFSGSSNYSIPEFESFRRRISFLQQNNPTLKFEIIQNSTPVLLYDLHDLLNRPATR